VASHDLMIRDSAGGNLAALPVKARDAGGGPLYAVVLLHGYPPTPTVSGTADPLFDDNRAFVARLRAAGGRVEHFVREGMPHGFYFFPGMFEQGDEAFAAIKAFLARTPAGPARDNT
jgi:acetyl esterase/lipase